MDNIFVYDKSFESPTSTVSNLSVLKRKDRRGHGLRGVLISPNVPSYRSRRQSFENIIILVSLKLQQVWPQVEKIEFCTQNVPPSDPAPWENDDVILGRVFDQDLKHNLPARIVLYRYPIEYRANSSLELKQILEDVICQQLSHILNVPADELHDAL